jgi:hypothetical protein
MNRFPNATGNFMIYPVIYGKVSTLVGFRSSLIGRIVAFMKYFVIVPVFSLKLAEPEKQFKI